MTKVDMENTIQRILEYAKQSAIGLKDGEFVPYALLINNNDQILIISQVDEPISYLMKEIIHQVPGNPEPGDLLRLEYIAQAAFHQATHIVMVHEAYMLKSDDVTDGEELGDIPPSQHKNRTEILSIQVEDKDTVRNFVHEIRRRNGITCSLDIVEERSLEINKQSLIDNPPSIQSRFIGLIKPEKESADIREQLENRENSFHAMVRNFLIDHGNMVTSADLFETLERKSKEIHHRAMN